VAVEDGSEGELVGLDPVGEHLREQGEGVAVPAAVGLGTASRQACPGTAFRQSRCVQLQSSPL
jgi:hypothetical protein